MNGEKYEQYNSHYVTINGEKSKERNIPICLGRNLMKKAVQNNCPTNRSIIRFWHVFIEMHDMQKSLKNADKKNRKIRRIS